MLSCTTEATLVEVEVSPRTVSEEASPRDPPEEASSVSEQAWDPYQVGGSTAPSARARRGGGEGEEVLWCAGVRIEVKKRYGAEWHLGPPGPSARPCACSTGV